MAPDAYRLLKQEMADEFGEIIKDVGFDPKGYEAEYNQYMNAGRPELAYALAHTSLAFLKKTQSRHQNIER